MKKLISIFLSALMVALLFSSCTAPTKISVNGTKISNGVNAYFLQEAKKQNPNSTPEEQTTVAKTMLCRYVAINTQFVTEGLALSTAEKSEISSNVNSYWRLFEKYYLDNNISKQDLLKVEESKMYEEMLLTHMYSKDGTSPIDEAELSKYFKENYIAFKALTGFLTTVNNNGEAVPLSDNDKKKLSNKFDGLTTKINNGNSIDEVCSNVENTTFTSKTVVIDKQSKTYPTGFFDTVFQMENNSAKTFTIDDYAFIVYRENLEEESLNLFATYKTDCLKALKGEEFEKTVNGWVASYNVD